MAEDIQESDAKTRRIRPVNPEDAESICAIYNYYIRETTVTFEEADVEPVDINARIRAVQKAGLPWIVAEHENEVVGYAYAKRWKERSAYRYSVEVSVYVKVEEQGKGWGSALYRVLFDQLGQLDIHLVIGGITLPNDISIALHEKFGMKKVAHFNEVGYKFGAWRDVGYWQKSL
jgi:phosphinothricin acetyltransferase